MITFGPVPSRRLGRSLGINNIPHKHCSYSCVYCQVGPTDKLRIKRQAYYRPEEIYQAVDEMVKKSVARGKPIQYLSLVPEGEPTLDINLGRTIVLLKSLGIKIAVFSNASLIWQKSVRNDLMKADWVSLKMDAVDETIWHKINRGHKSLDFSSILDGMRAFADGFQNILASETMLIHGLNDSKKHIKKIANFLQKINPDIAFLAIPTRPPAEKWVKPSNKNIITFAQKVFSDKLIRVESLTGFEGTEYTYTDNAEENLLSILAVQPMRMDAVADFLDNANVHWSMVHKLIAEGKVIEMVYEGEKYYVKKIPGRYNLGKNKE
jgi:wyosine [tRNA(Phe)-imidazoG37] synthetase (radical SAM superfamily)